MSNELVVPAVAAGAGAIVCGQAVSVSGMTAAGMVGGGAGFGAAAGPVGAVAGAVGGLAAYGVARTIGDMIENSMTARWYAHLNGLRDAAPETGPAQMQCRFCGELLWPRWDGAPWRTWVTSDEGTHCDGRRHDAHPIAWFN